MSQLQMRIYFILAAPFLLVAGLVLGLWFAPFAAFTALTVRAALKWESGLAVNGYAWTLAAVFVASLCWPFAAMYGIAQI